MFCVARNKVLRNCEQEFVAQGLVVDLGPPSDLAVFGINLCEAQLLRLYYIWAAYVEGQKAREQEF